MALLRMTNQIQRRLAALEANSAGAGDNEPPVLFTRWVGVGGVDEQPTRARIGDIVLTRGATEDSGDLIARAGVEARRQRSAGQFGPLVFLDAPGPL